RNRKLGLRIPMSAMKTILLLLLAESSGWAAPVAYEIWPDERAFLELTVEKTGFLSGKKHLFTFSRYQGTLLFDRDAPERSTITLMLVRDSVFFRYTWLRCKDWRKR